MGIGLANPAWLLGAGLIAPLVWLYLRVRPRPPATVSSLRIWRHVPSPAAPPRRRPKLPPLFFVQALLILVTSLALASPYRKEPRPPGPPRDALLVLDVSASMQGRLDDSTRFDHAIAHARERADELAAEGRRITLVRAGPQPDVVASGLDASGAREHLETLVPLDTSANLTAAIELAATLAGDQGSIDVFSDADADRLVMSRDARSITTVHAVGSGGANVAISDVRVQTDPFGHETSARLLITVRSYADESRTVDLEIAPLEEDAIALAAAARTAAETDDAGSTLESRPRRGAPAPEPGAEDEDAGSTAALRHSVDLAPRGQEVVSIDRVRWTGAFEARLGSQDDLPLDDVVYGYVPPGRSIDLLLVSEDRPLAEKLTWLAERAGSFVVRTVSPADYDPQAVGEITIFDRFVPDLPPASNVAYLAPTRGNADITVVTDLADVKVAERRAHPLLRGVTVTDALLGPRPVGLAPSALRPVLLGRSEGRELGLVQAGEIGGREIVATAFPISARALGRADDLPSLIFTLNLLSHLSPVAADAPLLRNTGERLRAGSRLAAPIERLDGPGGSRALGAGTDVTLEQAGIYEAESRSGTRRVYVSFVDATESDILGPAVERPATHDAVPAAPPPTAPATTDESSWTRIPYLREILFAIAAILLLEWIVVATMSPGRGRSARGQA